MTTQEQQKIDLINPVDAIKEASLENKPLRYRIWFWLTCWRPITKYELARTNKAWVQISIGVINNYRMIEGIINNLNQVVAVLRKDGKVPSEPGKEQPKTDDKKDDVMYN